MKKWLKIWLIVWWSLLVAWWARAWLTKAGVIPNRLWIEALCSCVDCKWEIFVNDGLIWRDWPPEREKCCEWTYTVNSRRSKHTNINNNLDYSDNDIIYVDGDNLERKPIIYLYPSTETEIHVGLWTPENLSHTYPKYNSEKWRNVIAQPNGDLEDVDTWRKLYALYREWKSDNETNFDEWFVVAWKDIIPFLEDKLAILGLNEREAEEFIVYWLPQMEDNEWNLIRFESIEEQNENMQLNITPAPDAVIRVMMDWKAIDEPIDIPEQQLSTPERTGFTVVEWWWSPRN